MDHSLYVPYSRATLTRAVTKVEPAAAAMLEGSQSLPRVLEVAARKLFLAGDVSSPEALLIRSALLDLGTIGHFKDIENADEMASAASRAATPATGMAAIRMTGPSS